MVGTIANDDFPVITLSAGTAGEPRPTPSVTEDGTDRLGFTFSRTGATTSELIVAFRVDGTASLGADYTGIPTTNCLFRADVSSITVFVNPTADSAIESDETVALTLVAGTR